MESESLQPQLDLAQKTLEKVPGFEATGEKLKASEDYLKAVKQADAAGRITGEFDASVSGESILVSLLINLLPIALLTHRQG
jgi:cell division protease FtsH